MSGSYRAPSLLEVGEALLHGVEPRRRADVGALVGLILGGSFRGTTAVGAGRRIVEEAGGLVQLIRSLDAARLERLGVGRGVRRERLLATAELARRYYHEPTGAGRPEVGASESLEQGLLKDPASLSDADLLGFLAGPNPSPRLGAELLAAYGGLSRLVRSVPGGPLRELTREQAPRVVAVAEIAERYHAGAVDSFAREALELAHTMLAMAAQALEVVALRPEPELTRDCAELVRRAGELGERLWSRGAGPPRPDLELIRQALAVHEGENG